MKGPVRHKKIQILKTQIQKFLRNLDYQGIIAFELFDTGENLIVNELAPRVHNSGHYSLDALAQDQFTIHLKAIKNEPLKLIKTKSKAFAMINLLGSAHKSPSFKGIHLLEKSCFAQKRDKERIIKDKPLKEKMAQDKKNKIKKIIKQLNKKGVSFYWYGKV